MAKARPTFVYRPSWILLVPAPLTTLRQRIDADRLPELPDADEDGWDGVAIVSGRKGYVAIYEPEPGCSGDEGLAAELSRALPGRHYLLHLAPHPHDPDHGTDRNDVYERGRSVGRVDIYPAGRLATHFGCKVPGLVEDDAGRIKPSELKVIAPRRSQKHQIKLLGFSIAGLADLIDEDRVGLSYLFDGAPAEKFQEAVDALRDPDAQTRRIAAITLQFTTPIAGWVETVTELRGREQKPRVREELDRLLEDWAD